MYQYTNNVLASPAIFKNNDSTRTFVQPFNKQENPTNGQNTIYIPKIKIKDLKELQDPEIISKTERNKSINNPYFDVLNNKVDQNFENDHSYSKKNYSSQTTSDKLSYHNLDIWLKERSLVDRLAKLQKKQDLIQEMRKQTKLLIQNNQKTYSLSQLDRESSVTNRKENPILEGKDKQNIDVISCKNKLVPVPQTEISNLSNTLNSINPYGGINNVSVTNNMSQNHGEGIRDFFEYICVGESAFVELGKDFVPDRGNVSTSHIKSVQNSTAGNCDTDYESRQTASLDSNVNQSNSYENKKTVSLDSNVNQSNGYENRKTASLDSNVNQSHLPSIEIPDEVDSTGLRDGIIKASRTLISTEKPLKLLLHTISRSESLPQKQTISLLRRFQNILKSFNKEFNEVDKIVKTEYKYLFSNPLVKEQEIKESLGSRKQEIELLHNQNGNCDGVGIVSEQPNAFTYRNKWQNLNIEQKSNTNCKKTIRQRSNKSDDEELDKSFEPAVQVRNLVTSRRDVPRRSCRKRHISLVYESQESENETD